MLTHFPVAITLEEMAEESNLRGGTRLAREAAEEVLYIRWEQYVTGGCLSVGELAAMPLTPRPKPNWVPEG